MTSSVQPSGLRLVGRVVVGAAALAVVADGHRIQLSPGVGCFQIQDREACCMYRDGRVGELFEGEDCLPAQDGLAFGDNACEPACFVYGTCGNKEEDASVEVELSSYAGSCPLGQKRPALGGCFNIKDRQQCCRHRDGREDPVFQGQDCVPSLDGELFDAAAGTVCEVACFANGNCTGSPAPSGENSSDAELPKLPQGSCPAYRESVAAGCYTIMDRSDCCLYKDGREGIYQDQDCVPSKEELFFLEESSVVCQPKCWSDGTCSTENTDLTIAGSCEAPIEESPAENVRYVDQVNATVPEGGNVTFYVVSSSSGAWQTWPDQLHLALADLGYQVSVPDLPMEGWIAHPQKKPICDDDARYADLSTPRFGMVGWASWGFAFDSRDDCDAEGFRPFMGYNISCINAWACNPKWQSRVPFLAPSEMAQNFQGSTFLILANWINDGKTADTSSARKTCLADADIEGVDTPALSVALLTKMISAVHAVDPKIVILVMARYPDTKQTIYVNTRTLQKVKQLNAEVKEGIKDVPNTYFVDYEFPLNENMFQTKSRVHPNCRGDKVMINAVLDKLFTTQVLAKSVALSAGESCLSKGNCKDLDLACCHRSALCHVTDSPDGGQCVPYSPGLQ